MDVNRSGFTAILGRPNVGKSTLLNALLGEKIAIVSNKPQTTRNKITGVITQDGAQVIFIDTPGLHKPKNKLGQHMVKAVTDSIADVDAAIMVVEPKNPGPAENDLIERLSARKLPAILVINKIDTLQHKDELMKQIADWSAVYPFSAVVPVSALNNDGVKDVLTEIIKLMPEGPQYFPDDTLTTEPERAVVAEIIREKLLTLLQEEIPHGTAVSVERFKERENADLIDIDATIYCEKESHKGIIIGKQGQMLKKIGTLSREEIETFLDCHVNLKLWVKVKEDWRNRENILKTFGFD